MGEDKTIPGFRRPAGEPTVPSPDKTAVVRTDNLRPPAATGEIGRISNYRVIRELGSGGMGMVYEAEDLVLKRRVALKVMKPGADAGAPAGQRFLREARALAGIQHENVVSVHAAGEENGAYFLAMELLKGESLEARIKRKGALPAAEIVKFAREALAGLAAIHEHALVHRDIKPSNIWIQEPAGRVKILDLGLVRPMQTVHSLTASGLIVGTPAYMAPEQARGEDIDARTDLFSLGSVLYTMCTGKQPFTGSSTVALLTALATATPKPPSEVNPAIPAGLSRFVSRLLCKEASGRPVSAAAAIREIDHPPAPGLGELARQHRKTLVPAGIIAVALALILFAATRRRGAADEKPGPDPAPEETASISREKVPPKNPPEEAPKEIPKEIPKEPVVPEETPRPPVETPPKEDPPPVPRGTPCFLLEVETAALECVWFPKDSGLTGAPDPRAPRDVFARFSRNGQESPHGIGMHPTPHGPATATFLLGRRFSTFRAIVTQNDGPREDAATPMTFSVYGDGNLLWKCKPFTSRKDEQECEVLVEGVNELRLEVRCSGEPKAAHALWFEPRLE